MLRTTLWPLCAALVLAVTVGSGWLHGRFVNRWGQSAALQSAADRMRGGLPARIGNWELVQTHALEPDVAAVLQCAACWNGVYRNDHTGDTVVVALVAGPAGPISVHTPEICYSAQNFEIAGDRQEVAVKDTDGKLHQLWQVDATSRDAARPDQRILYGWSRGSTWEAPDGPRFAFAGKAVLYKLQFAGPLITSTPDVDPCQEFLSKFLAQVDGFLLPATDLPPSH